MVLSCPMSRFQKAWERCIVMRGVTKYTGSFCSTKIDGADIAAAAGVAFTFVTKAGVGLGHDWSRLRAP